MCSLLLFGGLAACLNIFRSHLALKQKGWLLLPLLLIPMAPLLDFGMRQQSAAHFQTVYGRIWDAAETAWVQGDLSRALQLQDALFDAPQIMSSQQKAMLYLMRGETLHQLEQHREAWEAYRQLYLFLPPDHPHHHLASALIDLALGESEQALDVLKRQTEHGVQSPHASRWLARLHLGDFDLLPSDPEVALYYAEQALLLERHPVHIVVRDRARQAAAPDTPTQRM